MIKYIRIRIYISIYTSIYIYIHTWGVGWPCVPFNLFAPAAALRGIAPHRSRVR